MDVRFELPPVKVHFFGSKVSPLLSAVRDIECACQILFAPEAMFSPTRSPSSSPERLAEANVGSAIKYGKKNLDGTLRHLTWSEWYDELLAESIPGQIDEKLNLLQVPRPLSAFIIGTFFLGSFSIVFLYTYLGVTNSMNSFYMSLDSTDSSQVCYEVPAVRRGTFLVDNVGHLDTDTHDFLTNKAVYELHFVVLLEL